jgi:NADH-quinone oxidoreductase subunit M
VLLISLILLPLLGAVLCALVPSNTLARWIALATSLVTLGLAVALATQTDFSNTAMAQAKAGEEAAASVQHSEVLNSLSPSALSPFQFSLGADTISVWMLLLTGLLFTLAVASSFGFIKTRERGYYGWLLLMLGAVMGVFLARDAILLYVFFELTLVPAFFLIGSWGGSERRLAAVKFVVYTFASSVLLLAALLYLGLQAGSFDLIVMAEFARGQLPSNATALVLLGLLSGFAVKSAVFPLHSWLAGAYAEAPAPVTAILSGILAKLGAYGFIRLVVPAGFMNETIAGHVSHPFVLTVVAVLATVGILYGAMLAFAQNDYKRVLAFSSLSHLGFIVLAVLAISTAGMQGGFFYMLNHGISTGALFLMLGMLEQRVQSRQLNRMAGLGKLMPIFSFFMVLFVMSSIGLPGTNGFISEFACILSAFNSDTYSPILGVLAAGGVVLGAVYMLTLVAKLLFGTTQLPEGVNQNDVPDLNSREIFTLVPLAVLVIVLGFGPGPDFVLNSVKLPMEVATRIDQQPLLKPAAHSAAEAAAVAE